MPTAYIGMGANLTSLAGSPAATLAAAVVRLAALGRVVRQSSLYTTEPVGYAEQPRFTNAVVAIETELSPVDLLKALLALEKEFGRDRSKSFVNGPRTLDLDILLMGDLSFQGANLDIPHPRLAERAFVLVPLHEIAPHLLVPGLDRTVAQLFDELKRYSKGDAHAVVREENDLWRAGMDAGGIDATCRPGQSDADG